VRTSTVSDARFHSMFRSGIVGSLYLLGLAIAVTLLGLQALVTCGRSCCFFSRWVL